MEPALFHSVCDVTGGSLELSRKAAETDPDPIVFCGVRFMVETAKILNPTRTVLLPTPKGGCSPAESITAADVRRLKRQYPGVPVVTYVNTYADVKAESDICGTSSNATQVVESLDSETVILLPDEFLAQNVARETGKRIVFPTVNRVGPEKEMVHICSVRSPHMNEITLEETRTRCSTTGTRLRSTRRPGFERRSPSTGCSRSFEG